MNHNDKTLLDRFIPITDWMRSYRYPDLKKDLRAGLTVGILLIPQSMAYALLAGLPPVYGLYASVVPLIVYAIFGTSRQLGIGPVAIVSILVATGIGGFAEAGTDTYIGLVLATAFFVGITQFLMGLFRLGFLMNFISRPVLSGFTSAAAFIIGFSQLGNLLGVDLVRSKYIYMVLADLFTKFGQIHTPTLLLGLGAILLILALKKWKPQAPAQLIAVALAILIVWFYRLDETGVEIVGGVEGGFPAPAMPDLFDFPLWELLPSILAIAFLSFTQSIALAKAMVRRNPDYKVDSNQELFSLGLANMIGSIFSAYPVAGSFSRTAVNDENRAKTSVSLLISASLVMLTVLAFTPLIYYLPQTVLAAIIMTAVPGLAEPGAAKYLWNVRKREFALMLITFLMTLGLGILEGIGIGVVISLGIVLHRSSYPNIVMLGRVPGTETYRDIERYPEALTQTNTIIVRIDASLYFANISYMKQKLEELEIKSGKNLNQIIIDAIGINEVDSSALQAIRELVNDYQERDIDVLFTGVKGPVRDLFKRGDLDDVIGPERFFLDIEEAVASLSEETETESHLADEGTSDEEETISEKEK